MTVTCVTVMTVTYDIMLISNFKLKVKINENKIKSIVHNSNNFKKSVSVIISKSGKPIIFQGL